MRGDPCGDTTNVKLVEPTALSGGRPVFQVKVAEVALCLDIDQYHSLLLRYCLLWLHDHGGGSVDCLNNGINIRLYDIHRGCWVNLVRIVD
jgi:hypothetical protein